jgi:serine phosphatase RsbU (regulator of sigma subunit)
LTIPRERELIRTAPTLGSLDSLTPPTLLLMAIAAGLAALDGLFSHSLIVVSLLAFPPLIAATRVSVPETAVVGAFCFALAVLSGLWNENVGSGDYFVRLVVVLAGAGAALWVAHLRVSLARERDGADLLAETGLLLEESMEAQDRVEYVARLAVPDLADAATVDLCGRNGTILRSATVTRDPELERTFRKMRSRHPVDPESDHPAAVAIRTGEMVLHQSLPEGRVETFGHDKRELELIKQTRPSSVLVVPLKARGEILGALSMWMLDPKRKHDEVSQNIALRLAHRAGLALDNAHLHEQQAHIAQVLQTALRPRTLPEIEGFETASRFLAAGADAYEVGGDFYDAFRSGSGTWTVVIGDVCGKGPEAAALTALARYTIRTASTPENSPSDVLLALDKSIADDRPEIRFCTAAIARVRAVSNGRDAAGLTVALGGHPAPLALRRDGRVDLIGKPGTLLGALPSPDVADAEASLAPKESLILYTDGLLESRDRRKADDPGWLAAQISDANGVSADELADQLVRLAIKRQGGELRDDIAILVLQRSG